MGGVPSFYFWYGTIATLVFLAWLYWVSPRVKGKGKERDTALIVGTAFLVLLIVPDIWALTKLDGISWFVAWTIGLLFIHIIEGGIWHRIVWGEKCPECGAWVSVFEEPVPGSSTDTSRRARKCPKCGWTDSWADAVKDTDGGEKD
ncbi:MAG TPA: hypothetical protein ENN07_05240 [candidate division Zixibacteria bacterium]|nr:hypothetical protein [candidate division Zixibacteria bacterium]